MPDSDDQQSSQEQSNQPPSQEIPSLSTSSQASISESTPVAAPEGSEQAVPPGSGSVAGKAMSSYAYDPPGSSPAGGKPKPKGLMKIISRLAAGVTVVGCIILIIAVFIVQNLLNGLTNAIGNAGKQQQQR